MIEQQDASKLRVGDGLAAAHVFVAVAGALYVFMRVFETSGCVDRCNYSVLEDATRGFWILDLIVLVIALGGYGLLRNRARSDWLVPAVGLAVTAVALTIAIVAINGSLVLG